MYKTLTHKIWRIFLYVLLLAIVIVLFTALTLQFFILPNINSRKDDIASYVSNLLGQKVTIQHISASWQGAHPHINIAGVDVYDDENRSALHLEKTETNLAWTSLAVLEPRLSNFTLYSPQLTIRRKANGQLYIAGISMTGASKPNAANWFLKQQSINIVNAKLLWQDDYRKAPPLSLDQLDFQLEKSKILGFIGQHNFTLQAHPSTGTSYPIHINGYFYGNDISKLNTWRGQINADLKDTNLTTWQQWLDYPIKLNSGNGSAKLTLDFSNNNIMNINGNVDLSQVSVNTSKSTEPLSFKTLSGLLSFKKNKNAQTFSADNLKLLTENGLDIQKGSVHITNETLAGKPMIDATLNVDLLKLETINKFTPYFPIPASSLKQLSNIDPIGSLKNLSLHWVGDNVRPKEFEVKTEFNGLSIKPYEQIPGFTNVNGRISANEKGGTLTINTENSLLDFKKVLRWPIPISKLNGEVDWQIITDDIVFKTKNLTLENAHLSGNIDASYTYKKNELGYLDLKAKFGNGDAKYAHYYYPIMLGTSTLHWLDTSILAGHASDIQLTLKGKLADFPFTNKNKQPNPSLGLFRVTARLSDAKLEYGTGWPEIEGLGLNMLFEGDRMELNADKGHLFGNQIIKSHVEIPVLSAASPILNITSEVQSPVTEGVKYVNNSPVKLVTQGFTDNLKADGNGRLHLELQIPLQNLEAAKYKGTYQISNGIIHADPIINIPELTHIQGSLNFTESNLKGHNINAWAFGSPLTVSLNTEKDKSIKVAVKGKTSAASIKQLVTDNIYANSLSGNADWEGNVTIKKPLINIEINSDLIGMAVALPAPFNKLATSPIALHLSKTTLNDTEAAININYGNLLNANIISSNKSNALSIMRGDIGVNSPAITPVGDKVSVHGAISYINLDAWRTLFVSDAISANNDQPANPNPFKLGFVELNTQALDVFNRRLNTLSINSQPTQNGWKLNIQSQEIAGNLEWIHAEKSRIIAHFQKFTLPKEISNSTINNNETTPIKPLKKVFKKLADNYPALDLTIDNLAVANKKLGALELTATENDDIWNISKLKISNSNYKFSGTGDWYNWTHKPNTKINFTLNANNVGNALNDLGLVNVVKEGKADVVGEISWAGSPHEFEITSLNGNFKLDANQGQILKIKPGAGRLLGLLSLQSIPRRLTLNFKDLFNSGFAFDEISTTAKIKNGVMKIDDFFMTGPAAEVNIKGVTDLKKETQDLTVNVTPHISDSFALAAFAGGPVVGITALVAQKILKDPLNKLSASEYKITGTWDNPVEKSDMSNSQPTQPSSSPLGVPQ